MIGFAVVGAHGYALTHWHYIDRLAEEGRGKAVAAMLREQDATPDALARLHSRGVRIFYRYDEMLDACQGEADIVTLPTSIHTHAPMTVAALEAGYHVLVEKPVAGSLAEVDRMIAAQKASGRQCAVGFQLMYSKAIQTIKRYIVSGRLGRVRRIRAMALWPRDPAYYGRNEWAGRLYCDGRPVFDSPFNNALAHQLMNMLYWASPTPHQAAYPVKVEAELFRAYDIESFDTGCMRLLTDGGVEIFFVASHACADQVDPVIELEASKATARYQFDTEVTVRYTDGREEVILQSDPRKSMFNNVLDAVAGRVPAPLCTLSIGRAHVACIEAIHRVAQIETVPASLISVGEGGKRAIAGIEESTRRAFASRQMFSELGCEFATTRQ